MFSLKKITVVFKFKLIFFLSFILGSGSAFSGTLNEEEIFERTINGISCMKIQTLTNGFKTKFFECDIEESNIDSDELFENIYQARMAGFYENDQNNPTNIYFVSDETISDNSDNVAALRDSVQNHLNDLLHFSQEVNIKILMAGISGVNCEKALFPHANFKATNGAHCKVDQTQIDPATLFGVLKKTASLSYSKKCFDGPSITDCPVFLH